MTDIKTNLLIDYTTLLLHHGKVTGIQRVETNICNYFFQFNSNDFEISKVIILNKKAYIYPNNALKGYQNYLLKIYFHTKIPWAIKRMALSVFPFAWTRRFLDAHWKGIFRFLLPLYIIMLPSVIAGIAYGLTTIKEFEFSFKKNILFIPGGLWVNKSCWTFLKKFQANKGKIVVFIHDCIPITHAHLCEDPAFFQAYFSQICQTANLILSNSNHTTQSIYDFFLSTNKKFNTPIETIGLGFELSLSGYHFPNQKLIDLFSTRTVFISVNTIEPRKNLGFILDAFESLWQTCHANDSKPVLLIIGRYGWNQQEFVKRIQNHPEWNRSLFWFNNISDHELSFCYKNSRALISASIAEGFGLPIVEALSHHCPVIASDIPIYHEIGKEYCQYFSLNHFTDLAQILARVWRKDKSEDVKRLENFKWVTWQESTQNMMNAIKKHL
jgi:glycosyltransferase involved in cell wall biosynthesis